MFPFEAQLSLQTSGDGGPRLHERLQIRRPREDAVLLCVRQDAPDALRINEPSPNLYQKRPP
eukprot:2030433-Pyramimonas_sp.AAC.1